MKPPALEPAIRAVRGLPVSGWLPAPHWPSVRGRARADAGPLLLVAAVVAVVSLLAGAVPALMRATADDAVRDAVRRAGDRADIQVHARWEPDDGPGGGRLRFPRLAEDVTDLRNRVTDALGTGLRAALRPPAATVTSSTLKITDGSVLRTFELAYLADGPAVTWIAGGPPGPASDGGAEVAYDAIWPVQIGLSEAEAAALHARPGTRIPLADERQGTKEVRVSGVFRPADPADPGWRFAPALLSPVSGADGAGTPRFAGLLSPESLPDARLAFDQDHLQRTVWFTPDPAVLTWDSAQAIAARVVALKAASGSSGTQDATPKFQTQLDTVLRDVRAQIGAASAQASVLLTGVLAAAVLILLLAADLLVRRRAPALAAARQRGATLPDLAAELLLESVALALSAAALGLAVARVIAPGASWSWVVPVVAAAVVAGPAFGILAASRATGGRRVPANRSARRWAARAGQLRRAAVEAGILIAAVAAFVALHQRGIATTGPGGIAATGPGGGAALPASAPALGVLAGGLLLLRALPWATAAALSWALRSRRPLAVFGAARAAATSARTLPLLALVASAALASFALILDATAGRNLDEGAWRTVGADARVTAGPASAGTIAAAPGVRQAVTGQVTERVRVVADSLIVAPSLVTVDAGAYSRLLATTPIPGAPALTRLTAPTGGEVPALVRSADGSLRPGMHLRLPRDGAPAIRLIAVGAAPPAGGEGDVILVDTATIAAAGLPTTPNTVWLTGPGADRAAAATAAPLLRSDVLRERRGAPLTAGLLRLAWASAAILLAMALLGLALGAAAGAPDRWQTLSRLRTLGLRPRDARWVAAGELLPPVLAAAVTGPLMGVLLAHLTLGPFALRLLTGQPADPTVALPWWGLALVAGTLLAGFAATAPIESALRRRRRLSEVLRAGTS